MYGVFRTSRQFNLSVECQLDLFIKVVFYIAAKCGVMKMLMRFLKIVLNMKTSTPNFMVYGESGRFPLAIIIKSRMVSFRSKLILGKDRKLCFILYNFFKENM